LVSAVGVGTAIITATSTDGSNISKTCEVIVEEEKYDPNAYLLINKYTYQFIKENEKLQLNVSLSNGKSTYVTWSTDNSTIAEVDNNGLVTAKSGGFANIYATSKLYGDINCWIYVSVPVTLSDGEKAYVGDLDGNGVIDMNDSSLILEWYRIERKSPDDILIADIDGNKVIDSNDASLISQAFCMEAFRPGNEATIREVTISKGEIALEPGKEYKLTANLIASNTQQNKTITWSSSNSNVATVDQLGNVKTIKEGTAVITAKSSNGKKATCIVTVKENKPQYALGDVNQDGDINVADYTTIIRYIKGYESLTQEQKNYADVNKDGDINVADYTIIIRHIKGYEIIT